MSVIFKSHETKMILAISLDKVVCEKINHDRSKNSSEYPLKGNWLRFVTSSASSFDIAVQLKWYCCLQLKTILQWINSNLFIPANNNNLTYIIFQNYDLVSFSIFVPY